MLRIRSFIVDKDPSQKFTDNETQKILKSITRLQLNKIFRKRPTESNTVEYKFMTTEQIEDEIEKSFEKAEYLLQMPPIVKVNQSVNVPFFNVPNIVPPIRFKATTVK